MTKDTDRRTVERILAGEVEAFTEIVERWQGPLVNLAFRYCRDAGIAEELAQDAFVKIYRNLGRWRGSAKFSTWLFAVALNVYRSWCRRSRLPTVPLDALEQVAGKSATGRDVETRDLARLVREAVLSLPAKYRDAVILYYFREMDLKEAAAILGLPEGTLKSHLHRARKMLASHLPAAAELHQSRREEGPWTGSIEFSSLNKS